MSDARWMRRCLQLAARAEGRAAPNPMVGTVVVRDGAALAEGWHAAAGQDHAEPAALKTLNFMAQGATLYVNLEPCCTHGRTPPCTDAILRAGVQRVVVGTLDPNPRVNGQGVARLRAAGVQVDVGVEEQACRRLNAGFIQVHERGRPLVWLKAGITLDGRIADANGTSQWITGPEARAHAHTLRDRCDAVMVGSGTLLADDPSLNTRVPGGRDALPVVLDTHLRCPVDARVITAGRRPLLVCAEQAPQRPELSADLLRLAPVDGRLPLDGVLAELAARGVLNLLVEGGGRLSRALLDGGFVDRLLLYVAPKLLAGGPGFVAGPGFALKSAPEFRLDRSQVLGNDLLIELSRSA